MSRNPLIVDVVRGNVIESTHQVMAVVTDANGHVVQYYGNAQYLTLPRSAIKPLQALAFVETGSFQKFDLPHSMLALACGSHQGSKEALALAKEWLVKVKLNENQLICAGHLPFSEANLHEMIKKNEVMTHLHNNCVGKHLGILTTCLHMKENLSGYEKYDHPSQARLRRILGEAMQLDQSKMPYGMDGCGIPTYAVPLQNIAIGMSALINPKMPSIRKMASETILQSIRENPYLIAGVDDFSSQVIEKTKGRSIIKSGAEGVYCGVLQDEGIAFAVKAADGAARAARFVVASLLLQYKGVTREEALSLPAHFQPQITNWAGVNVGSLQFKKS